MAAKAKSKTKAKAKKSAAKKKAASSEASVNHVPRKAEEVEPVAGTTLSQSIPEEDRPKDDE